MIVSPSAELFSERAIVHDLHHDVEYRQAGLKFAPNLLCNELNYYNTVMCYYLRGCQMLTYNAIIYSDETVSIFFFLQGRRKYIIDAMYT